MWTAAQMDLFEQRFVQHGAARWNDPQTSKDAAKAVDVSRLEEYFLLELANNPSGLTSKEISQNSGYSLNSISPRSAPLKRKGLIKDSGLRRNKSTVWVLTELGRLEVEG